MEFEWDEEKAESNWRKHGISFEFATGVFLDVCHYQEEDLDVSGTEVRQLTIGLVRDEELFVVTTERGDKTRMISARRATRYEREQYWQNR